jgi:ketosteroid isomerase-like protein
MDIHAFLTDWIAVGNSYNTAQYLEKYWEDAVLTDPSVGRTFKGHKGIREYFDSYFISYQTQTRVLELTIEDHTAHMEVEFTGTFPEGKIGGMFDFIFRDGKIASVRADLMESSS